MKKNLEIGVPLLFCLGIGAAALGMGAAAFGLLVGLLFTWLTPYAGVNIWLVAWKGFIWGASTGLIVGVGAWLLWLGWKLYSRMALRKTRQR